MNVTGLSAIWQVLWGSACHYKAKEDKNGN